ncbi:MAG: carboxypeptidase M32 [Geminicoccaceae bacterium]|nr:carboxypeptidase M32 [Geminicoccaceae bacterium]
MQAYPALRERFRRISGLSGASAILGWDQSVMMPKGASAVRGEQLAVLSGMIHELVAAAETGDLIERAREEELDGWEAANLREIERSFRRATALDGRLVEAITRATSACEMTWRTARADNDFASLAPRLEEVLALTRESAQRYGEVLDLKPYDACLENFQPGLKRGEIESLFAPLEEQLPEMIDAALARQGKPQRPTGPFVLDKQRQLARSLMEQIGFDFDHGRLDESAHPFCGGVPGDHRLTTRYREDELTSALMGVLHETGHALYEAGLPAEWVSQPVGEARGMAAHESQSLLMEMQACRSPQFVGYLSGRLIETFGDQAAFATGNLTQLYTHVERGLIRVDADELTYPLHIILRFRLERALMEGDLAVADLPGAWNDGMEELLQRRPDTDREGLMQDIHWPIGAIGYFPSYTVGAILAAQLFAAARRAMPQMPDEIGRGDFSGLLSWLREHVHGKASRLELSALVEEATGRPLGTEDFLAHLRQRYLT